MGEGKQLPTEAMQTISTGDRRALQRLLDERTIEQLLYRYARGVDRGDVAVVRSCYWDEGFDDHMGFAGHADEFCAWLAVVLAKVDVLTHQFTNVTVTVGEDGSTATSDAYCNNTCVWKDGGRERHLMSCLSYVDRWERRDGEWRLLHRVCRRVWSRMEEFAAWDDGANG